MRGVMGAADRAVALAREVMQREVPGSLIHDVSNDPRFQHRGVDLLWERPGEKVLGVEVKGDRQGFRRKTYFFELISNAEKDSPGCFLYSIADLLVYVFVDVGQVAGRRRTVASKQAFSPLLNRSPYHGEDACH